MKTIKEKENLILIFQFRFKYDIFFSLDYFQIEENKEFNYLKIDIICNLNKLIRIKNG